MAIRDDADPCRRELDLVMAIDRVRDELARDPERMLKGVMERIAQALQAEVGMLILSDDTGVRLGAVVDPGGVLSDAEPHEVEQITTSASASEAAGLVDPPAAARARGVRYVLAAPLAMEGQRLGSIACLSRERAFGEQDVALMEYAARQADSAVMQARTWKQLEDWSEELQERTRQLSAIYRVDRLRDQVTDTVRLLAEVANVLVDVLVVDLCIVGMVDEESGECLLKTVNDRIAVVSKLGQEDIHTVLQRAVALDTPAALPSEGAFATEGLQYLFAAPLKVEGVRLGAIVLANRDRPFKLVDADLAQAVVSQADSGIAHALAVECAQERARQLEVICRVDRLRDEARSAHDFLPAVVDLVTRTLGADLCLISLVSEEDGSSDLRAIQDRDSMMGRLDRDAIEQAINWASAQTSVSSLRQGSPLERWGLRYLIGAPLIVAGEKLGALVLASQHRPFGRADSELVQAIVSQADSAVAYIRAQGRLMQRHKELETLYRVDHIRDQGYEFGEMLSAVLSELCSVIDAEMGFIMLFDREGRQLELRASTAGDLLTSAGHYQIIEQVANEALSAGTLHAAEGLSETLHAIICVPLILQDRIIGVFGAVNRHGPGGFTAEDKRMLLAITSQVDTAIFESLDKQRIRETFQRYVGPKVMEQMLTTPEKDFLKGKRAVLTALFSDMRGFTATAEQIGVDVLVEMLNMHLGTMTEIVLANNGTLDKFVADEVVAVFGAPLFMPDHALLAVRAALEMQAAQQRLIGQWQERGHRLPPIGIGVNTGEVVVGNIGCELQMDYTVIGDAVNLASRLCDAAAGGQILITDQTYKLVAERIVAEKLSKIQVKGKEEPVQVYQVIALK